MSKHTFTDVERKRVKDAYDLAVSMSFEHRPRTSTEAYFIATSNRYAGIAEGIREAAIVLGMSSDDFPEP